jgi:hypothetical protein
MFLLISTCPKLLTHLDKGDFSQKDIQLNYHVIPYHMISNRYLLVLHMVHSPENRTLY